MKSYRPLQLSGLIQKTLGEIIHQNIEFLPGVLVTLSDFTLSKDMLKAKVWVSVIPTEAGEGALEVLKKSRGEIQYLLGEHLKFRMMPRIEFALDLGLQGAARVEQLSLEEGES